jgi:hypothetical protein
MQKFLQLDFSDYKVVGFENFNVPDKTHGVDNAL